MKRRDVLKNISLGAGALAVSNINTFAQSTLDTNTPFSLKGNINHSVCRWCFSKTPLEELAEKSADMGIKAIDLLKPEEWAIVSKYGLKCSLGTDTFANIKHGFNAVKNHKPLQEQYSGLIDKAADAGVKQVIVFSGNRFGMDDEIGLENCAVGLDPLIKQAEKRGVTVIMELLNSKVNHKDYMCDNSPWGIKLVDKIGSENFKLLYDIYHMQVMEGDIIATIRQNANYYGHYHTAGVPGRNEIGDTQELYYPAIMKAIVETGFKGYVAQEFIPVSEDKLAALRQAIQICDV
ncbi:TIM barrel protein [Urechidicola sp. KH5]